MTTPSPHTYPEPTAAKSSREAGDRLAEGGPGRPAERSRGAGLRLSRRLAEAAERGRLQRAIYAVASLSAAVAVAVAFTLYVRVLPDGSSSEEIGQFLRHYQPWLTAVALAGGLGTIPVICASASFSARVWEADRSPRHALSWIAFASEFLVLAIFLLEIALLGVCGLLANSVSDDVLHGLYAASFGSAYIIGPAWVPFFLAILLVSRRSTLLPRWLAAIAVFAMVANLMQITGIFTLAGPFNLFNGLLAIGGGTVGPVTWFLMSAAWMTNQWLTQHLPANGTLKGAGSGQGI